MPVRKYQSYEEDYTYPERDQYPLYQEYIPEEETAPNLKELLFFMNIAIFCVLTALFSFLFLSLKLNAFLSFSLAIGASLVLLKGYQLLVQTRLKSTRG